LSLFACQAGIIVLITLSRYLAATKRSNPGARELERNKEKKKRRREEGRKEGRKEAYHKQGQQQHSKVAWRKCDISVKCFGQTLSSAAP
jgi:hypothetical protein